MLALMGDFQKEVRRVGKRVRARQHLVNGPAPVFPLSWWQKVALFIGSHFLLFQIVVLALIILLSSLPMLVCVPISIGLLSALFLVAGYAAEIENKMIAESSDN